MQKILKVLCDFRSLNFNLYMFKNYSNSEKIIGLYSMLIKGDFPYIRRVVVFTICMFGSFASKEFHLLKSVNVKLGFVLQTNTSVMILANSNTVLVFSVYKNEVNKTIKSIRLVIIEKKKLKTFTNICTRVIFFFFFITNNTGYINTNKLDTKTHNEKCYSIS